MKRELKEIAWRTVFCWKSLSCLVFTWLCVVLKLCYLPSAIICAKLVPLCCAPPVQPPFFPLILWQWSGLWRCLSDRFSTASPKILLILLFPSCNCCRRQSILLLSAYHGSCGCSCVITSCLIFPCWLGKLFWDAVFSQPLGIWLAGRVLIMYVPLEWQSIAALPCAIPSAAALPTAQEGKQLLDWVFLCPWFALVRSTQAVGFVLRLCPHLSCGCHPVGVTKQAAHVKVKVFLTSQDTLGTATASIGSKAS